MIRLLSGDCRDMLPTLAADSVQCVVTSPPYYGLRDYGTALWDGGDADCQHTVARNDTRLMLGSNGMLGKNCTSWTHRDATPPRQCSCGARRIDRQIGLEASPDEYLATMVAVFREVRRVLRPDGTVWCNLGDSYAGGPSHAHEGMAALGAQYRGGGHKATRTDKPERATGLAAKQLLLMPARLALALQADGWWVRSDIIWHKPNPMPESCTDRPTSSYEHVFLLTRSARYFYDADAVREGHSRDWWNETPSRPGNPDRNDGGGRQGNNESVGRNLRNVWTIATSPFSAAHFATFPPELAERCIRAGTSERGACSQCGKPWQRITDTSYTDAHRGMVGNQRKAVTDERVMHAGREDDVRMDKHVTTTGWSPGCQCHQIPAPGNGTSVSQGHSEPRNARERGGAAAAVNSLVPASPVPCTVLDPFAGAGTTLLVADRLQRDAIGIELNTSYTTMAMERCRQDAPLFADLGPAPEHPVETEIADLFADLAAD